MNAIHDLYEQWSEEAGVKIIAISIDDESTKAQVPLYVRGKDWKYKIYFDLKSEFKKAMGVSNIPYVFLLDGNRQIIYNKSNYAPGDEEEVYSALLELD